MSIIARNQKEVVGLIMTSGSLEQALGAAISRHDPRVVNLLAEFDPKGVRGLLSSSALSLSSSRVNWALAGGLLLQPAIGAFPFVDLVIDDKEKVSGPELMRRSKANVARWSQDAWSVKRTTIEDLEVAGLTISEEMGRKVAKAALWSFGSGCAVAWTARRGWLNAEVLQETLGFTGMEALYACFETESQDVLQALEELVDLGVLVDGAPNPGWTDFAGRGQSRAAELLRSKGFLPRKVVGKHQWGVGPEASVFEAWLHGEFGPDLGWSTRTARTVGSMEERLATMEWLARSGALSGAGAPQDPWSLVPGLACPPAGPAQSVTIPFMRELARFVPPPKAESGFWPSATFGATHGPDVSVLIEGLALAGGSIDPTRALSGLTYGGGKSGVRIATLNLMRAAGFDPKLAAVNAPADWHPVAAAYKAGAGALASALLDAGAGLEWRDPETGETVLHMLASKDRAAGRAELSKVLARPEAKELVNLAGWEKAGGATALMRACSKLDVEAARSLLDAGAEPNIQDARGGAALHWVGRSNAKSKQERAGALVRLLIERGADPGMKNIAGKSPAQKLAGHAALGAVSALVHAKLDELCGEDKVAKRAQKRLASRGAEGLSVAENAAFAHEANASGRSPVSKKVKVRL